MSQQNTDLTTTTMEPTAHPSETQSKPQAELHPEPLFETHAEPSNVDNAATADPTASLPIKSQSIKERPINKRNRQQTFDTRSLIVPGSRKDNHKLKEQLIDAINLQTQVNVMLNTEITRHKPDHDRLKLIQADLAATRNQIHAQYEHYRQESNGAEKPITQLIDKFTHDITVINDLADDAINQLSAKTKNSARSSQKSMSHRSSYRSSQSSKSKSSNRTSSSEIYRRKQLEAQAKAAELEAQLHAEQSANKIDQELAKLEGAKKTVQIQAQLAAEQRKAAIFGQAHVDEERQGSGLMLPAMPPAMPLIETEPQISQPNVELPLELSKAVSSTPIVNKTQPKTTNPNAIYANEVAADISGANDQDIPVYDIPDDDSDAELELPPPVANPETRSEPVITPIRITPCNHSTDNSIHDLSRITNGLAEAISSAFNMNRLPHQNHLYSMVTL